MILVDSNVLLDLIKDDPVWSGWSLSQLEEAALEGPVLINSVVYAELSVGYSTIETLEEFVVGTGIQVVDIPKEALFLAGKVFMQYRRSGGIKTGVLPDFFIGAHAEVSGLALLTRDIARYKTYFPMLTLIARDGSD